MYGLLLDTIQKFIREKYGENYWANIRRRAKLSNHWFVTHEGYPESVIPTLVDAAAEELGEDKDNVMMMFGEYFAENIGRYGYARLLRVLGRDLRDFLNGLVDLHEYLRFSYPNMSPPAFFTANETPEGLHLHYVTKREGFLCYVIGQMKTIGNIYGKQLQISVISQGQTDKGEYYYILDLKFDNRAMLMTRQASVVGFVDFQISSETFFKMFPFSFIFSKELVICRVGRKLQEVLPGLYGEVVSSAFTLLKPYMAELDWDSIQLRTNCTFELQSVRQVQCTNQEQEVGVVPEQAPQLKLKGEMMPLDDQEYVAFLCSPALVAHSHSTSIPCPILCSMDSPEDLYESGIFISDLSLHNCSREFIMAGSQKHPELNIAFSQERIRSAQLETSIKKTDELLYQMIPKSIADKLRSGQPPLSTCQEFNSVSILFSDIVSFTPMCTRLGPMQVVCVLNSMCTAYDRLCEKYNVYKVEMIGDAYMVLAGGPIPSRSDVHHVESITNYGLGILEATKHILDPSTNKHLRIRVGIHSGGIVAGVVGNTTQRYDVFGDTVNIAARMESTGEPMRIQVSEATALLLQGKRFILSERGQVEVKASVTVTTPHPPPSPPQLIESD
ncbi:Soluble guanylate cyclase 88E, partial [Geodia barretti]